MMSLIDLDDDQRWVPTHVNVTVLRARGLRTKGKHGSRYLYTIMQVGKEKYTTGLVEKAEVPQWNEECCFELLPGILEEGGRSDYPPGSGDLVLTVMHRVLIGLDVFLGQTIIPIDRMFQDGACPRDEWFKLNSKAGRKEKERGELQVTVQFTRNNMTASMFDLTMKDKPRSAFGKLKDRVTGRKRGDMESSSAIVPGRYAALSGSTGQPFGDEGGGVMDLQDVEIPEEKRSKMKDFFKGKLRKSSDTRSCSSLASDSSMSSMASDNPGPPPSLDLLSDPPSSPIYTSKVKVDTHYGETDLAKKVLTSQHSTKVLTHKRALSDEATKITTVFPRTNPTVESVKGQTMTQSKSSLCINGSHVYDSELSTLKSSGALPSKLVLLEKCSPLSRSLQNLTKRSEDKGSFSEGRRFSFDKMRKEEKEEEKEAGASFPPVQKAQTEGCTMQATMSISSSAVGSPEKGRKLRKTLFSGGRSESLPVKSDLNQTASASEGRLRGWFGSSDSQNKPRLEVSPKVESSSDVPPHSLTLPPQCSSPSPSGHVSPDDCSQSHPFTPTNSPSSNPISPSNPFLPHMQRNPFFEELIAEESQRSPTFAPCSSAGSSPFHYTTLPCEPHTPSPSLATKANASNMASIRRERPRPVARQISLPALLPKVPVPNSPNHTAHRSMSESAGEWDDFFDAFASSRLNTPKGSLPQKRLRTSPTSSHRCSYPLNTINPAQQLHIQTHEGQPPPLPPRRLLRTSVNEIYSDGWLHRGQELAIHKEAYLLSQTGAASLQHGRNSVSPDLQTSSETADSLTAPSEQQTNITTPGLIAEEKLKKFKYEPLEDDTDRWGGMLFEQDLYGRLCRGNYRKPIANNHCLSSNTKETVGNNIALKNSTQKVLLDSEISVIDLLNMSPTTTSPNTEVKLPDRTSAPVEEAVESNQNEATCINNNVSFPLALGDPNMNVNNLDFGFIDSDGSSQSEVQDTLKSIISLDGNSSHPTEDSLTAFHKETTPEDIFTLKDTYIPDANSSFEITVTSRKLCRVSPVCQGNCHECRPELSKFAPHGHSRVNSSEIAESSSLNQTSNVLFDFKAESSEDTTTGIIDFNKKQRDIDDNGNPQAKQATLTQTNFPESFSGVVSARFRPKSLSRQNSSGSPNSQSKSGDKEFEQLLSLIQNISEACEGPMSYQPTKSSMLALDKQTDFQVVIDRTSTTSVKDDMSRLTKFCLTGKPSEISFQHLHEKVAPDSTSPSKSKIGQSLQETESCCPSIPSTLPLTANAQVKLQPPPACCPSINLLNTGPNVGASTTLVVAPYTSSTSLSATSTTDQPLVDAGHSLLPEETQPANSLPHQESRPHPVKPLTSSQSEKKEGRSVLEKLRSTIHPGRSAAQQVVAEAEKIQEVTVDKSAQYQHLTNMELISLLLQQEMDMQKQQVASDQQEAKLKKCEAEIKKVKAQVRDLEDYIDNLLLRIMEQTPTLLQVRTRHK